MDNRKKVVCAFVGVAIAGYCAALATVSYLRENELNEFLEISVESELRFRLAELETYRATVLNDVTITSNSGLIGDVLGEFSAAFDALGPRSKEVIQNLYIADNPFPAGVRDSLFRAQDGSDYSRIHGTYHGWLRSIAGAREFQDLLLVRADGTVVYSVSKQLNFGSDLRAESERTLELAKLFETVMTSRPEEVSATRFLQLKADSGEIVQFVGIPIFGDGLAIGALVAQLGVEPIYRIITDRSSVQSGLTTYIATSDGRNLVRPGTQPNDLVRLAMNGASGTRRGIGIDGRDVFAGYAPARWLDGQMVLITEFDMRTADRRKWAGVPILSAVGALLAALAALAGWLLGARDPD